MTYREKLKMEHPENVDPREEGGCVGCPGTYGYADSLRHGICGVEYCYDIDEIDSYCHRCWDQEIPGSYILDKNDTVESPIDGMWLKENPYIGTPEENGKKVITESKYGIEKLTKPRILDSGNRREFESGAVRDICEGKGRCDLLPLDVVGELVGKPAVFISDFMVSGDPKYLRDLLQHFADKHYMQSIPTMLLEVSKHFEEGCKKYGDNNWQKGIPVRCYIDSAVRHYLKYLRGDKDEPHDRAFCWNILCCIWTCKHKPELNDYAKKEEDNNA